MSSTVWVRGRLLASPLYSSGPLFTTSFVGRFTHFTPLLIFPAFTGLPQNAGLLHPVCTLLFGNLATTLAGRLT